MNALGLWLVANPRGVQVTMPWNDSTLLGDVMGCREENGSFRLTVRHFNGEPWPVEPALSVCTVLERTYTDA
jgi:hypothetical protein